MRAGGRAGAQTLISGPPLGAPVSVSVAAEAQLEKAAPRPSPGLGPGPAPQGARPAGDTLEAIFGLQRGFSAYVDDTRYPSKREERISALCTAIIQEAAELQATTNWKWWKRQTRFDEASAREELIDIWHFVVQASLELGLSPADVLDEYKRKNRINIERQKKGY